jgi:hypothetical protein
MQGLGYERVTAKTNLFLSVSDSVRSSIFLEDLDDQPARVVVEFINIGQPNRFGLRPVGNLMKGALASSNLRS